MYGVYYEPVDRSPKWRRAAFLGLYHDKQVSHVGRIVCAVLAVQDDERQIAFETPEIGTLDDTRRQAVRDVIVAAQAYYPGLEGPLHRYYVVDAFAAMDFRKSSPAGMMGHRYFDIENIAGRRLQSGATAVAAAEALHSHSFT